MIGRRVEIMKTEQTCSNKTEEGRAWGNWMVKTQNIYCKVLLGSEKQLAAQETEVSRGQVSMF